MIRHCRCYDSNQPVELVRLYPNLEELGIIQVGAFPKYTTLFYIRSDVMQPDRYETPKCISAAQGLRKLRLLEVVLPRFLSYRRPLRHVWDTQMKEHAITVLGNIDGHTKVLKMTSIGSSCSPMDIHDVETQAITIP